MGRNDDLVEAVANLRKAEKAVLEYRTKVADLLKKAVRQGQSPTDLHKLTEINRATIYWLMNKWSTSDNRNRGN
jgi:hypothetical protein